MCVFQNSPPQRNLRGKVVCVLGPFVACISGAVTLFACSTIVSVCILYSVVMRVNEFCNHNVSETTSELQATQQQIACLLTLKYLPTGTSGSITSGCFFTRLMACTMCLPQAT